MNDKTNSAIPAVYPQVGLLIDGKWVHDRPTCHEIINPSTEKRLGDVPGASARDLDDAVRVAQVGFDIWRRETHATRAKVLHRTAEILRSRAEQIATTITLEQGKTLQDSRNEVARAATFLDWDAEAALRLYGRTVPADSTVRQFVEREPVGPVAAFTPWNVPISSPSRKLSAALAAGCSVIIKPAEETPASSCQFAQCFLDAGLPPQALGVVFGSPADVSSHLIRSPGIRMVTLTGSVGVGRQLSLLAAEAVKPCLMELGGHAPVLIDSNVDPARVAAAASLNKFRMAGQICAAPSRFLVHKAIYKDFVDALSREAESVKVGDGFKAGVQMGPVANVRRLRAMEGMVADALSRGGRVAAGGRRIGTQGYFYAPTVIADVPLDAQVMEVEPFGPIAPCYPVDDMEQGLHIANSLPVGLQGFVFTNTPELADRLERELQVGVVSTNGFTYTSADTPFGGVKESGLGREGGEESLASYLVTKTIIRRLGRA